MDEAQLEAIKARAEKATPGPWYYDEEGCRAYIWQSGSLLDSVCHLQVSNRPGWRKDAAFIAHARTDLPALVEEVERLREALRNIAVVDWLSLEAARDVARYALEAR